MVAKGSNYLRIDVVYGDALVVHPCSEMGNGIHVITDGQGFIPCRSQLGSEFIKVWPQTTWGQKVGMGSNALRLVGHCFPPFTADMAVLGRCYNYAQLFMST